MNVTSRRLPAPSPVTNDVVASRLGVAAFIFSLVSIIVLAIAVVIGPVRIAVMIIAILLSSLLAWILAIIAAKRPLISGRAKNLAGWGIILGTIAAIIEFIRIV